jgi:hypothetical protein
MNYVETLLEEEITREFRVLSDLAPGNEDYKIAVEGLTKLTDRAIEIDKIKAERKEKREATNSENYYRTQQLEADNKDRLIKNVLSAVSIIGGFALTVWGTKTSIKFEETGTITTIMGRGFINKLLPKK